LSEVQPIPTSTLEEQIKKKNRKKVLVKKKVTMKRQGRGGRKDTSYEMIHNRKSTIHAVNEAYNNIKENAIHTSNHYHQDHAAKL